MRRCVSSWLLRGIPLGKVFSICGRSGRGVGSRSRKTDHERESACSITPPCAVGRDVSDDAVLDACEGHLRWR